MLNRFSIPYEYDDTVQLEVELRSKVELGKIEILRKE